MPRGYLRSRAVLGAFQPFRFVQSYVARPAYRTVSSHLYYEVVKVPLLKMGSEQE